MEDLLGKREGGVPSYTPFLFILLVVLAGILTPIPVASSSVQHDENPIPTAMPEPLQGLSLYTLQGVLEYFFGDSADSTITVTRYFLSAGETRTELLFDTPPWYGYLSRQVVVEGTAVSMQEKTVSTLRVSRISLAVPEQAALSQTTPVTGTRKVILLLVKFSGDSQEPHPASWYTDIFNPSSGNTVNSFYLANSWGQFGWIADTTNWMTGLDSKTTYANCGWDSICLDYNHLFNDAVALGVANGVTFSLYDNIAIVTNNDLDCCAYGTSAKYYNGKYYGVVWEPPWSAQVGTFAHELGHSIGLPHSGWVYHAYDSPWDVMSEGDQIYNRVNCGSYYSANYARMDTIYCPTPADIIAPYKDAMGWIDSSHLLTVTAGSPASVQVDTLAAPLSDSKKMIKICVAGKDCTTGGATAQYYTVEVRTHYTSSPGFDYYLENEGVIIHYYWSNWTGPTHNSCYFNYQYGPAYPIDNFNVVPSPHFTGPSGSPACSEYVSGQKRGLYYANWNDGQTYSATGISVGIVSHSTAGGVTTYIVSINGGSPFVSTDKSTYAQLESIYFTGTGFTAGGSISSCISTNNVAGAGLCVGQASADGQGKVAGSMLVGTNIPPGPQKFWVADLSTSIDSNAVQLTITSASTVTVTVTRTLTESSTSYLYRTTTTTTTSYTSTSTSTSTIPTVTTVVLVPLTITSTEQSTQFLTPVVTTTVTNYTSTTTSTSTIPTTVALVASTVTSIVQNIQYLTSILGTTVTNYTGTQTSTSTIVVPTTVVLVPSTVTSTAQSTQFLTSTSGTTVTNYTSTETSTSTILVPTTVVLVPLTATSTIGSTQYLTSTSTTTVTNYTNTSTSTSTSVVYTTVTVSQGGAGANASNPLAYLGFMSVLAIMASHGVTADRSWRIPRYRYLANITKASDR